MVTETNTDKIEIAQSQIRVWVLVGVVAFLLLLVQGLYTYAINATGTEMRETNRNLLELLTTVKVHQTQLDYLGGEIRDIKQARKDANVVDKDTENRLNSLEQRAALHDQWIQAHNH